MTLKIVGAGFGRTGTRSMKDALEQLGFGPCHHMAEVMDKRSQEDLWDHISLGQRPDWNAVFAGYQSSLDWPSISYWREIADAYPDAKVLVTSRPVDDWFASFSKTILQVLRQTELTPEGERTQLAKVTLRVIRDVSFHGNIEDEAHMKACFEAHNAAVEAAIPEGRRLTFTAGDGWEPLCRWLDVPVPETPFPYSNTTAEFQARQEARKRH